MKPILKIAACIFLTAGVFFVACKKEKPVSSVVTPTLLNNQPPIANAGADQTITLPTNNVTLEGSGSTDPDGTIISYQWSKISGPSSCTIINTQLVQTKVDHLVQGVYQFELKVTDKGGVTAKDTVQTTVIVPPNQPPVANAGPNQIKVLPAGNVKLDGSNSHDYSPGNIVSYSWTKIDGPGQVTIANPNLAVIALTGFVEGAHSFRLQVTDNDGATDADTVNVKFIRNTLSGQEFIEKTTWESCIFCDDGYLIIDSRPDLFFDPDIPVEISILSDTSSVWVNVPRFATPLPANNHFYYVIRDGILLIQADNGKLIGKQGTVKAKFL